MAERLDLELGADLGEIGRLAEAVEAFGERLSLPMKTVFNLNLAFDELITNTISYGLTGDGDGKIHVSVTYGDGELVSEIVDAGRPFDPFAEAPPPDLTSAVAERPIGGLGVHLVKTLIDEVEYRREDGRNHIVLRQSVA